MVLLKRNATERITAVIKRFAIISTLSKKSFVWFFAKIPNITKPKSATGVKLQSMKRSRPVFVYSTDSVFLARRIVMNSIKTAATLTIIRQFFVSAVEVKLFFHRKQPAAKIRIEHMRYRIEVLFSGDKSVMKKYAAARAVLKRYVYFSFLIAMIE